MTEEKKSTLKQQEVAENAKEEKELGADELDAVAGGTELAMDSADSTRTLTLDNSILVRQR